MARYYSYSVNFDYQTEKLFKEAVLLGEGHNGIVYELPQNKVLKIFLEKKICKQEAEILLKVRKSKYFPKIHKYFDFYIIREKVCGMRLDHYIKLYGLSESLSKKIYFLIKEFEDLKFTKIDARCRDIYVEDFETLKVIDPKQCYNKKVSYPRHLMKGLNNIKVLGQFLNYIKTIDEETYYIWNKKINEHLSKK